MGKIRIAIIALIVAILFTSAIVGTVFYYDGKISNLNSQISNLKSQLTNPTNLTSANLVTGLGITKVPYNIPAFPYNFLDITGSVTNTGKSTAYNAGLNVVAYNATGALGINLTVSLSSGTFGTDKATDAYVSRYYPSNSSSQFEKILDSGQTHTISINILYEGNVSISNWTVTPVWTNSP
jgi:hypothetical protein